MSTTGRYKWTSLLMAVAVLAVGTSYPLSAQPVVPNKPAPHAPGRVGADTPPRRWRERLRLNVDWGAVSDVAFAPDGATLATAADGGQAWTVKLWDVQTGRQSATLRADPRSGSVRAVAFSPDGKTLASGMSNKLVLWDVRTKRPRRVLDARNVTSLAFSPDGQTLATGGWLGCPLKLWHVATGREGRTFRRRGIGTFHRLALSPDGKLLAAGYGNEYPRSGRANGEIDIWDLSTGTQRFRLQSKAPIDALAFSPDGRMLASGGRNNGELALWEVATGQQRAVLQLPGMPLQQCRALAFAPDGRTLAADWEGNVPAPEQPRLVLWDVMTRRRPVMFKGPLAYSLAFAPDGKTLAAGSMSGSVTLWQTVKQRSSK